jgi:amino acid permease
VPDITELKWIEWAGMPLFLSQALVCFEGNGAILNLYAELDKPKHMFKMIFAAFFLITALVLSLGLLSYRTYGSAVQDTILFNLP